MITIKGVDPRMIANNLSPYRPIHPGEILKDEIEYRGISQRKLASQMGVSYSVLNEILNCKRPVNTEYAILLEAALGVEADTLIRMQSSYNMQVARKDKKIIDKFNEIRKLAVCL
jgi:addiction module HigA family antidote